MNLYEHTIIARQDSSASQIKQIKEKYIDIINKNKGNIIQTQEWGLMNLSYLIKKNRKGNYIHFKIEGDGSLIKELEKYEKLMAKRQSGNKKGRQSNFAKLSIFQPNKYKFKKTCPLSVKGAPEVDYKNIKLLKKYVSENGKILPSRITNISQKKQRELSLSVKRARNLALI